MAGGDDSLRALFSYCLRHGSDLRKRKVALSTRNNVEMKFHGDTQRWSSLDPLFHKRRSWSSISDSQPEIGLGTCVCVHVLQI